MDSYVNKIICSAAILLVLCHQASSAEVYNVGHEGWGPGFDYTSWVNGRTFAVGDTFVFVYIKPHNVAKVDGCAAKACNGSNPIFFSDNLETFVRIDTPGEHYFISTAPGDCQNGMLLNITVAAA